LPHDIEGFFDIGAFDVEGFFDIKAFDIEGFFDFEYTTFDIRVGYLTSISKMTKKVPISES
jgi:hypothetical protein